MSKGTPKPESSQLMPACGVVMPISGIPDYPATHWADVMAIIAEAAEMAGFRASMVSSSNDAGIIHKNIIKNLYESPIVVCDVSSRNPNVMLELGMRLAFEKPVVVIKDDATPYSFDTSPLEHIGYPRDLRFGKIVEFKDTLAAKIKGTHDAYSKDPAKYESFFKLLGGFTDYKPTEIATKSVGKEDYLIEQIVQIQHSIAQLGSKAASRLPLTQVGIYCEVKTSIPSADFNQRIMQLPWPCRIMFGTGDGSYRIVINIQSGGDGEYNQLRSTLSLLFNEPDTKITYRRGEPLQELY